MMLKQNAAPQAKPKLPLVIPLEEGMLRPDTGKVRLNVSCPDNGARLALDLCSISEHPKRGSSTIEAEMDWAYLSPRLAGGLEVFFMDNLDMAGFKLEGVGSALMLGHGGKRMRS